MRNGIKSNQKREELQRNSLSRMRMKTKRISMINSMQLKMMIDLFKKKNFFKINF
jgi:hypothetical protein